MDTMGLHVVTLLLLGVTLALGTFTGPENIVKTKHSVDTELTCTITGQASENDKAWWKTSESGTQIANDDGIISGKETDYELDSDTDKWNLKIKKRLEINDGDKYICKQNTNTGTARLIVVDVTCGGDREGTHIKVYCDTPYSGDWKPVFKIKKGGSDVTPTDESVATEPKKSRYVYTETAPKAGDQYECELDMDGGKPDLTDSASNIPDASAITCSYTTPAEETTNAPDTTAVTGESLGTKPMLSIILQGTAALMWLAFY